MARTFNAGTRIGAKVEFLIAVEDDSTVKVFKSKDSGGTDNTAAVQSALTITGSLTYADITWGGGSTGVTKSLKTFKSASSSYITFGATKPYLRASTTWANGLLAIYLGLFHASGNSGMVKATGGGRLPAMIGFFINPTYGPKWYANADSLGSLTSTPVADSTMMTTALKHKGTDSANSKIYFAESDDPMAITGYAGNANNTAVGGDSYIEFLRSNTPEYWSRGIALYMICGDDYSSDADRLTDLQGLHDDPYGVLFGAGGGGGSGLPVKKLIQQQFRN